MIIFDTETTGLIKNESLPLDKQPKIIEFGAIKVDEKFNRVGELSFLINPKEKLEKIITKITGIKDSDLVDAKTFPYYYKTIVDFFLGETTFIAHNLPFDRGLLLFELQRMDKQYSFPWPYNHICTVELSRQINGKYMKLTNLYKHLFNTDPEQTHRALDDCEMLLKIYQELVKRGFT